MSSRIALAASRPARSAFIMSRGIQTSAVRFSGLKESSEDPQADKHKRDSLENQKQGKGFWKPELASDSEEAVKADRDSTASPAELAERTKRTAEETAKHGTSMRDGL